MLKLSLVKNEDDEERKEEQEVVNFVTGNPRVETLSGSLHLYRTSSCSSIETTRGSMVCLVDVPPHMAPIEILEFTNEFRSDIVLIRILKDPDMQRYMALLDMKTEDRALAFYSAFNGRQFNSIEQDRCKIVFVQSMEIQDAGSKPPDDAAALELPTCAVCLDRLDLSGGSILTTICNHTFHCDCLYHWENSSCPVCRYSQGHIESNCEVCGTTEHLWICLICGHIGCGRYTGEHAKQHYQETMHTYSLELETQRVWDYAGDGYVHRLILNKQDGKCVEFPDPNGGQGRGDNSIVSEEEDSLKLEKLAVEYNFLLTSQLEEQRSYYERLLLQASGADTTHQRTVAALEKENRLLTKRNAAMASRVSKLDDELKFVRELNTSLIANQDHWKKQVEEANALVAKTKDERNQRVEELEAQVRDVMFYLDTQQKVDASPHKQELQHGQVLVSSDSITGNSDSNYSNTGSNKKSSTRKKKK